MKIFKRLAALFLSLIFVLSLSTVTFADNGSITITNATIGENYYVYKIFDATYNSTDPTKVSYTIENTDAWYNLVNASGLFTLTAVTGSTTKYSVTTTNQTEIVTWFTTIMAAGQDSYGNSIPSATTSNLSVADTTVTFSNLDYGYYLVYSTTQSGTAVTLTTTNPSVEVVDKNQAPTMDTSGSAKQIYDGTDWADYNTAAVGEEVWYKLEIEATNYSGSDPILNYVFTDVWEYGLDGFDPNNVIVVLSSDEFESTETTTFNEPGSGSTVSGKVLSSTKELYTGTYEYSITYTDSTPSTSTDGTFTLTIPWVDENGDSVYPSPTTITVYYSLTLNEYALAVALSADGNLVNEMTAEFNTAAKQSRIGADSAYTVTYNLGIRKYDGDSTTTNLAGATFTISTSSGGTPLYFVPTSIPGVYQYDTAYDVNTPNVTTTVTTQANGRIVILGLDAGTYYLTETEAPNGYNPLTSEQTVTINGAVTGTSANGNLSELIVYYDSSSLGIIDNAIVTDNSYDSYKNTYYGTYLGIANYTGTALPSTGGIGTTIFYVGGGILVVAAGILLVAKRRMNSEK